MTAKLIAWLPPFVVAISLALTGALAARQARRRRGTCGVLAVVSVCFQWTAKTQTAVVLCAIVVFAATSAPMPWSVQTIVTVKAQWFSRLAWLLWGLAVGTMLWERARQSAAGKLQTGARRSAINLLGTLTTLLLLACLDDYLDSILLREKAALFNGNSIIMFRAQASPELVEGLGARFVRHVELAATEEGQAAFAIDVGGRAWRWDSLSPRGTVAAIPLPGPVSTVSLWWQSLCAIRADDGRAFCESTKAGSAINYTDLLHGKRAAAIDGNPDCEQHVRICAISAEGEARCWSARPPGLLEEEQEPFGVELRSITTAFGCGGCVARKDGGVGCWASLRGQQLFGEVEGVDGAVSLASSTEGACAVTRDGALLCWKHDREGLIPGNAGGPMWRAEPFLPGVRVSEVAMSPTHTCAIGASKVYCWGDNRWGQLCDGSTEDRAAPISVPNISDAVSVAVQGSQTCIVRASGAVMCCGMRKRF